MLNLKKIPQDCSAEKLFKEADRIVRTTKPLGYALQGMGNIGSLKIPYWAIEYDPCEDNTVVGGIVEHDNYICLCKWVDGSPITFRFSKYDLFSY